MYSKVVCIFIRSFRSLQKSHSALINITRHISNLGIFVKLNKLPTGFVGLGNHILNCLLRMYTNLDERMVQFEAVGPESARIYGRLLQGHIALEISRAQNPTVAA